ncbi:MAG: MoxR family ATPase [Bifidobacteriaceae bacterium]|jgi:MoxR-like ATPase|nr:MoxR family ATPase [Bifidobacteriaceae bacterium]MCI1978905.1 MoxR family ATPase [Bifidobacteriaceae bacterium]
MTDVTTQPPSAAQPTATAQPHTAEQPPDTQERHELLHHSGELARAMVDKLYDTLSANHEVIELAVETLFAGGHLLMEDMPGVGKTTLARALGILINGTTHRIQFTSDMLPSDLTGVNVYDQHSGTFTFRPGPLFAHVVIADEINRANPKTQSAMLEAMGERQVSIDGTTHPLPQPYFVIATENPIELEGTYPLPEAQLDRFMARTSLGYPSPQQETQMLLNSADSPLTRLSPLCTTDDVVKGIAAANDIIVSPVVAEYLVQIVGTTRSRDDIKFGASPRASLNLLAMCRSRALLKHRDYVTPEDVQQMVVPVLSHRIVLRRNFGKARTNATPAQVLKEIVNSLPAPRPHVS